jgi:DNA-binding NarL/FixJ family response regulator
MSPMSTNSIYAGRRARIVIADDHLLIAEACQRLLEPEFEIVGIVPNGRTLVESLDELRPDVVILDISMPGMNGLDAAELVKGKKRDTKLIYMTMTAAPDIVVEAFRRGASGYVLKHGSAEEIRIAVRAVLRGRSYLSSLLDRDEIEMLRRLNPQPIREKKLSERRKEILRLTAAGRTMREIATILNIKHGTVAFHKYRMMAYLGVKTTAGLIDYAARHDLISTSAP